MCEDKFLFYFYVTEVLYIGTLIILDKLFDDKFSCFSSKWFRFRIYLGIREEESKSWVACVYTDDFSSPRSTIHRWLFYQAIKKSSLQTRADSFSSRICPRHVSLFPSTRRDSGWNVVTRVSVLPAERERERESEREGRGEEKEETRCDVEWVEHLRCTQLSLLFGV